MAWRIDGNHSGIAIMVGDADRVHLQLTSTDVTSMSAVVDFIASHAYPDAVIAIDASLVVKNATGQRPCETLIGKTFGRYRASCHTSHLRRPYATTGMRLVRELEKLRFHHDFDVQNAKLRPGRWVFEVYPHPAMVRLFGLHRITPYKKGRVSEKRAGLAALRRHLLSSGGGI